MMTTTKNILAVEWTVVLGMFLGKFTRARGE